MSKKNLYQKRFDAGVYDGNLWDETKIYFRETVSEMKALVDRKFKVTVEEVNSFYNPSRYKYYFGYVMFQMVISCADQYQIRLPGQTAFRPVQTPEEMHECMKLKYRPVLYNDIQSGRIFQSTASTTGLSNSDFINEYEEQIMADHSFAPYNVEFWITRDEFNTIHKARQWHEYKEAIENGVQI